MSPDENEVIKDLELELETKMEIIRILKDDLSRLNNKCQALEGKCDGLQIYINSELTKFVTPKKTFPVAINKKAKSPTGTVELTNSFTILEEDFPDIAEEGKNAQKNKDTVKHRNQNNTSKETTKLHKSPLPSNPLMSQITPYLNSVLINANNVLTNPSHTLTGPPPPFAQKNNLGPKAKQKNKVLILADSHGRKLSELLNNELNKDFITSSIFHPNATLTQVTADIGPLTTSYTKNDFVLVIGGTNDLGHNMIRNFDHCLNRISACTTNTNLLIANIPLRFDQPVQFQLHRLLNSKIESFTQKCPHATLIDLLKYKRTDFTRHGLHLNYMGKLNFTNRLATEIRSRVKQDQISSSMPKTSRTNRNSTTRVFHNNSQKELNNKTNHFLI